MTQETIRALTADEVSLPHNNIGEMLRLQREAVRNPKLPRREDFITTTDKLQSILARGEG